MTAPNYTYFHQSNGSHSVKKNLLDNNHFILDKNNKINYKNGISPEKNIIDKEYIESSEKFIMDRNNSCFIRPTQSSTSQSKSLIVKGKYDYDKTDTKITTKNYEREMPQLTKEIESDSKDSRLNGPPILNQRYQNVLRFPNYRPRKKGAFVKKLRRCGVELDGETTISNLRKILQPYIYKEIDNILDKYIEAYFMKAIHNIRENINVTSEIWSDTLKSSISKSLYKQYCEIANVDPFDPISIANDDFPYFQISQRINQKENIVTTDNSAKYEIDNSTGHTSDTNSHCSQFSMVGDKLEIDQDINIADISSSSEQALEYSHNHLNGNADNHMPRKRNINDGLCTNILDNSSKFNEDYCPSRKYQKIVYPNQSYSHSFVSHYDNTNSFILQNNREPRTPETARFETSNKSFLLMRKSKEQSSSAIESDIYLNSHKKMTTNNIGDHMYTYNYNC